MKLRIEFKRQDAWVGAYWEQRGDDLHVWLCLIPMLPIHFHGEAWYVRLLVVAAATEIALALLLRLVGAPLGAFEALGALTGLVCCGVVFWQMLKRAERR